MKLVEIISLMEYNIYRTAGCANEVKIWIIQ